MSAKEIYQKHYKDISEDVFTKIVSADIVTSNLERDKLGGYAKWLLKIYAMGNLKLEDLYKAKEYIPTFHKLSKSNKLQQKDINLYKKLSDMYVAIKPYLEGGEATSKGDEIRKIKHEGADKLYEDAKFIFLHIKTWEAAKYYGKNTEWCTASNDDRSYFDHYNSEGELYIIIDKTQNRKYQFYFEDEEIGQFMDENDSEVSQPILSNIGATEGLKNFLKEFNPQYYLELQFELAVDHNDKFLVKIDGKSAYLDKEYNRLTPFYDSITGPLGGGVYRVRNGEKNGFLDSKYNIIVPIEYKFYSLGGAVYSKEPNSDKDYLVVGNDNKWGYMETMNGRFLIEPKYDYLSSIGVEPLIFMARLNNRWGLVDSNGKILVPLVFDDKWGLMRSKEYQKYDPDN